MMWLPKTMSGRRDAQNLIDQHSIVRRVKLAQSARSCDFGHVEEQRLNMAIYQARSCDRTSTRLNSSTNAHLVCSLLLEKKNKTTYEHQEIQNKHKSRM